MCIDITMARPTCSQFRMQLKEIKELKTEFDLELPKIKDTRNTAPALKLEEEIRGKIKDALFFARFGHLEWAETTIGTKSREELIKELEDREKSDNPKDKIYMWDDTRNMITSPDFKVVNKPEKITLIKLKVKDLGLNISPTTDELYSRAKELGLELCPPEIGPHLRLNYQEVFKREQPKNEYLRIGMKPIIGSGSPGVFIVYHNNGGEWRLSNFWAKQEKVWDLEGEFVFACK